MNDTKPTISQEELERLIKLVAEVYEAVGKPIKTIVLDNGEEHQILLDKREKNDIN